MLGGGGHKGAAGATVKGSIDEVKTAVLDAVKQVMEDTYAGVNTSR